MYENMSGHTYNYKSDQFISRLCTFNNKIRNKITKKLC